MVSREASRTEQTVMVVKQNISIITTIFHRLGSCFTTLQVEKKESITKNTFRIRKYYKSKQKCPKSDINIMESCKQIKNNSNKQNFK